VVREIYARFGNNNFVIHSHLTTFGHGVFPLASRLFNHSCLPNAAAKYTLSASNVPRMDVVALRDIAQGEEVRTRM
jgi:SET and MYND domain-containing protein